MEYKLVEVIGYAEDLELQVNSLLSDGWQLYGNPFVYIGTEVWKKGDVLCPGEVYCQALIRNKPITNKAENRLQTDGVCDGDGTIP